MKIVVAGTGYVGFVHAAVCSEYGQEVYAYDNDIDKIKTTINTALLMVRSRYFVQP